MINDLLAIINLGEHEEKIHELTVHRPIAAIPFGGRYRVIDFILSSIVNSGIQKVGIFTKDKFHSLTDHIGPGKSWDLDRKREGLTMLHPNVNYTQIVRRYGDLEVFKDHAGYIEHARQGHVLLVRSNMVGNIDFSEAFSFHQKEKNDITMLTKEVTGGRDKLQYLGLDTVELDEIGDIKSVGTNLGNHDNFLMSVDMMILKKEVLLHIIRDAVETGDADFLKQAIFNRLHELNAKTFALEAPIECINSITNYYRASMSLLEKDKAAQLYNGNGKIYTKIKDEPSAMYVPGAKVKNALVANGCIIEGTVENSIIFRGVHIKKGAEVRNCILMQDTIVGEKAQLNFIITDKNVKIADKKILMGDGGVPYVIQKNRSL